jgi:hypothetical protein
MRIRAAFGIHSKISYSNATPSGSFSSNQVSATSSVAKTFSSSPLIANPNGHFQPRNKRPQHSARRYLERPFQCARLES